ncbi:MAG: CPBP family intramembrane metalloprotease [Lachnospiraceae bacterium]|nr:CPBP family intramembrane metalloprotease [Lachnospiraceae bacterium]
MRRTYNRGGWSVVALYGVTLAISGIIGNVVAVLMSVGVTANLDLSGDIIHSIQDAIDKITSSPEYIDAMVLASLIGSALGMGLGMLLMHLILPKDRTAVPYRKLGGGEYAVTILMAFGLWGVGALIGNLPEFFGVHITTGMEEASDGVMWIFMFYALFGAPLLEELAFRKLLLDAMHPYGKTVAAFTSAMLFGLMHGNSAQFMLAFMLGLLLAAVYMNTGNIWYTILIHFLINLTGSLPDLFMFLGIDISIPWYVVVGMLVLAGFVTAIVYGPHAEVLRLSRPEIPDANRQAFKNPGMLFAMIGGLVLIGVNDLMQIIGDVLRKEGAVTMIRLIPTTLAILSVIFIAAFVGRKTKPEAPAPIADPSGPDSHTAPADPEDQTGTF